MEIVAPIPSDFVKQYLDNQWFELNKLLAPSNMETRNILYSIDVFQELIDEIIFQAATGMSAFIGSYAPEHPTTARNHLTLVFVLTKNDGTGDYHFSIEDVPGFGDRDDPMKLTSAKNAGFSFLSTTGFDTGSPCPPAVCNGAKL